jgi:AraC family transcriptional activator of pobA
VTAAETATMNEAKQFYVFRLQENGSSFTHQQQADYYAISLVSNNTPGAEALLCFHNPQAPQPGGSIVYQRPGFSCLFNAAFLSQKMQDALHALPMFRKEARPVYYLNKKQNNSVRELFEKMLEEANNNYAFKYELLGNYLAEIIHHALKMQPNFCSQMTQICTDQ